MRWSFDGFRAMIKVNATSGKMKNNALSTKDKILEN